MLNMNIKVNISVMLNMNIIHDNHDMSTKIWSGPHELEIKSSCGRDQKWPDFIRIISAIRNQQ